MNNTCPGQGSQQAEKTIDHVDMEKLAVQNYCLANNLPTWTLQTLFDAGEHVGYWATLGLDTGACGSFAQQLKRALAHLPASIRDGYPWLDDVQKQN